MTLTMECDGYLFRVSEELGFLLAHCAEPPMTARALDLTTLQERVRRAVADRAPSRVRHVLHAGGTR